ncbi:MAG: hypothetical protein OHK0017_03910 [Patescibacteria group bacterium]
MTLSKLSKVIGLASVTAVALFSSVGALAADDTNVSLSISAGVLTIYAGDSVDNNDICTPTNITNGATVDTTVAGGSAASVVCSTAENSITLTGLSVASSRQSTTANIDDIVFEDLRGLATADYTITATVSNFSAGAGKAIDLGTNPDGAASDVDADAPDSQGADANKLFANLNCSGGTVSILRDGTAVSDGIGNYQKGSSTTVVATSTPVTVLSTTAAVRPPRAEIDGCSFKLRVPSYVQAGNYTGTITQTIV